MSDALKEEARRTLPGGDHYLALLAIGLLGYALMGRGFAYIGFPPFYVGEIALLTGLLVFVRSGALVAALATLPSLVLAATMVWVLARTVPFVGVYGFDALRDSVIVMYGGFAFIVIGLLLEDARRIDTVLRYYRTFAATFPAIAVGFWLTKYWADYVPKLYGPNVSVVEIGASAAGTHLAGTAIFVLIGYRKVSPLWVVVWVSMLAMVAATNRGATLAAVVPVIFAMVMLGRLRLMLTTMVAALSILGVLYVVEASFGPYDEAKDSIERPVSAHQLVENIKSIVGQSGQQTEGTKTWRLDWWDVIINDTFHGPNFWTGRGFGLNLADADGFSGTEDPSRPTRSPHNAHMTLLARAGVPGVVLWSLVIISWGAMMLRAMLVARARGNRRWADLFLFTTCYAISIVINAMFDVTLEGPVQGIWFWCLFGFGIGSVMVYRAQMADGIGSSH
jgi:O-Antigen ligase